MMYEGRAYCLAGVGAFGDCIDGLVAIDGMIAALREAVIEKTRPFLGICVGMQLMAEKGFERGTRWAWLAGRRGACVGCAGWFESAAYGVE